MKTRACPLFIVLISCALMPRLVTGQEMAAIRGRILASDERPIYNAKVWIQELGGQINTISDAGGHFQLQVPKTMLYQYWNILVADKGTTWRFLKYLDPVRAEEDYYNLTLPGSGADSLSNPLIYSPLEAPRLVEDSGRPTLVTGTLCIDPVFQNLTGRDDIETLSHTLPVALMEVFDAEPYLQPMPFWRDSTFSPSDSCRIRIEGKLFPAGPEEVMLSLQYEHERGYSSTQIGEIECGNPLPGLHNLLAEPGHGYYQIPDDEPVYERDPSCITTQVHPIGHLFYGKLHPLMTDDVWRAVPGAGLTIGPDYWCEDEESHIFGLSAQAQVPLGAARTAHVYGVQFWIRSSYSSDTPLWATRTSSRWYLGWEEVDSKDSREALRSSRRIYFGFESPVILQVYTEMGGRTVALRYHLGPFGSEWSPSERITVGRSKASTMTLRFNGRFTVDMLFPRLSRVGLQLALVPSASYFDDLAFSDEPWRTTLELRFGLVLLYSGPERIVIGDGSGAGPAGQP